MIFDKENCFTYDATLKSVVQSISTSAGDVSSTNVIDLTNARDIGPGNPIAVICQLTDAPTGTSPTIVAKLTMADDAALTTNANTIGTSLQLSGAGQAAGDRFTISGFIPEGTNQRYLGVVFTIGGTGTITYDVAAGITAGNQTNFSD